MFRRMKTVLDLSFGILAFIILGITGSKSVCSLPNFPAEGGYSPRQNRYQPGDNITYSCTDPIYKRRVGTKTNTCGLNGEWSEHTPFCDQLGLMTEAYIWHDGIQRQPVPSAMDADISTCFTLEPDAILEVKLEKAAIYRIWLYIKKGGCTNIEAHIGGTFMKPLSLSTSKTEWYVWHFDQGVLSDTVAFDDQSCEPNTICEIQFDVNVAGCANPPKRKIAHGYFEVSRNRTTLICEDGYNASGNNELVCEENEWKGDGVQCEGERKPSFLNGATIGGIASGVFIVVIALIGITICCCRKQRRNEEEVVEVHRPSKMISEDDNVEMHLYEAMNYYETMHRNAPANRAPKLTGPSDDYTPYFLP